MGDTKRYHRISMNTSLKNARIFDDDAWEEGENGVQIQKGIHDSNESMDHTESENTTSVKQNEDSSSTSSSDSNYLDRIVEQQLEDLIEIKKELQESYLAQTEDINHITNYENIKKELDENYLTDKYMKIDTKNIKKELEENYLDQVDPSNILPSHMPATTPLKKNPSPHVSTLEKIKEEPADDSFNESPFNKELFKHFKIKEQTPVKENLPGNSDSSDLREELNYKRSTRKSVKRTIFTRNSPYKRDTEAQTVMDSDKCMSARSRLGPKMDESNPVPAKKSRYIKEVESNPEVLGRRQKQIDYGRNTSGYDNYIKTVPRNERKPGDPQTPDKYAKYSRRGWEGLIKQWRIKLHKYDPADT